MIIYKDIVELAPAFPFQIDQRVLSRLDNCADSFHWHDFCEITFVQNGKGNYYVNGIRYEMEEGDLIIFNHVEPHGWMIDQDMEVLVMIFSTAFVSELSSGYLKPFVERGSSFRNKVSGTESYAGKIAEVMKEIQQEYGEKALGYDLLIKADVLRILTILFRYYQNTPATEDHENIIEKSSNMKRLEEAFCYINEHYTEKITLGEVAKLVFMSENYFGSYFKRVTNTSFTDYLAMLRLKKAKLLMEQTDGNMVQIAMECGFNNMSNFYRIYKKHMGEAPRHKQKQVTNGEI